MMWGNSNVISLFIIIKHRKLLLYTDVSVYLTFDLLTALTTTRKPSRSLTNHQYTYKSVCV